ncbi:MAG: glutathione peroxidase [Dinoroseobacter sp.]|jgi:glutathione peroxidase
MSHCIAFTPKLAVSRIIRAIVLLAAIALPLSSTAKCHDLLDFTATKLRSSERIDFCEQFANKAVLVVNTASQCGYTAQFKSLEQLHKRYSERLAIVGFPSNDFRQEHADSEKISDVCYVNYGVTFTMLEPSSVKGEAANTLFKKLAKRTGEQPHWNFNKYLISTDGSAVKHFASRVEPTSDEFIEQLDKLLADP